MKSKTLISVTFTTVLFYLFYHYSDVPNETYLIITTTCLGFILICICIFDFTSLRIPNALNATLLVSGVFSAIFIQNSHIIHVISAALMWFILFWTFAELSQICLKKEALGMGDVKMMAGIGAWFGFTQPISIILIASWIGLVTQICLILFARMKNKVIQQEIPLGFYLGIGCWYVWLYGPVNF